MEVFLVKYNEVSPWDSSTSNPPVSAADSPLSVKAQRPYIATAGSSRVKS